MTNFKIKTEPTIEPVSVEEAKLFAHIDNDDEDTIIETLIKSAREMTERFLGRALINQTITVSLDAWPQDPNDPLLNKGVDLPRSPVSAITEIRVYDDDGNSTTIDSDDYWLDSIHEPNTLYLKEGASVTPTRTKAGIEIDYIAGYGSKTENVPAGIRAGIMQAVTDMYETRVMELSESAKSHLQAYRIIKT